MSDQNLITIPARKGKAARVARGQMIKVINTYGEQVVDTWAFNSEDPSEFMSMEHSRAHVLKIMPAVGDVLLTNRRRPILGFMEDTAGAVHDTLIAACDRYRYELLGCTEHHDNCTDNLRAAMLDLGLRAPGTPCPLNLFMNIPVHDDDTLSFEPPVSSKGSYVVLRAEMDLVIVFSACPQDMVPINGRNMKPTDAHFQVLG